MPPEWAIQSKGILDKEDLSTPRKKKMHISEVFQISSNDKCVHTAALKLMHAGHGVSEYFRNR